MTELFAHQYDYKRLDKMYHTIGNHEAMSSDQYNVYGTEDQ
jgi:hypothetical protein